MQRTRCRLSCSRGTSALLGLFFTLALGTMPPAHAQSQAPVACGSLENAFGPFDFRKVKGESLHLVEIGHFTPLIEGLVRGKTGPLGADIDYTLRAFPNHHRALVAMQRLTERLKRPQAPGANFEVECYFMRAVRFVPDDSVARLLYASFLGKQNRRDEAKQQLAQVETLAGENVLTHYNLGLVALEVGDHERALRQAWRAQEMGFTRPELREQLRAQGRWRDPPAPEPAGAASAPAAVKAATAP